VAIERERQKSDEADEEGREEGDQVNVQRRWIEAD
jgi:hypothetical protein